MGYSFLDYLKMPITWIVILLLVIIFQLSSRPCMSVGQMKRLIQG